MLLWIVLIFYYLKFVALVTFAHLKQFPFNVMDYLWSSEALLVSECRRRIIKIQNCLVRSFFVFDGGIEWKIERLASDRRNMD